MLGSAPLLIQRVGAHLANAAAAGKCEVDFVVRFGRRLTAIEVKSGRTQEVLPGVQAFNEAFKPDRLLLVGGDGITVENFLCQPVEHWLA